MYKCIYLYLYYLGIVSNCSVLIHIHNSKNSCLVLLKLNLGYIY